MLCTPPSYCLERVGGPFCPYWWPFAPTKDSLSSTWEDGTSQDGGIPHFHVQPTSVQGPSLPLLNKKNHHRCLFLVVGLSFVCKSVHHVITNFLINFVWTFKRASSILKELEWLLCFYVTRILIRNRRRRRRESTEDIVGEKEEAGDYNICSLQDKYIERSNTLFNVLIY